MLNFAAGEVVTKFNLSLFQNDFRYCLWSIKYGFRGPNFAVSACASSTNALLTLSIILD
jgi:3-oxoacyl-(acyl-carrier-protein) synthase